MFKLVTIFAALCIAATSAGLIQTHHVVEPVVAKVATVVHSAPSAVSHQSLTQVHNKAVVHDVLAPAVKTTTVHHAAPLLKTYHAPVVHTYAAAPVVKTYHAAPAVVHSVPAVVHESAPLVKTVVSAPFAYTLHH